MNIVFVGTPATPYAHRACDVRVAAFANLMAKEHKVCVLNRYSSVRNNGEIALDRRVIIKEIIGKKSYAHPLCLLLSIMIEPFSLLKLRCKQKVDVLHVYSGHYVDFVFYRVIAKLIGAKVAYQYVEYRTTKPMSNWYDRWNGRKCDFNGAKLWDGVISISDYLTERSLEVNPKLKHVKVTPICDFSSFDHIQPANQNPYLLFCGSIGYMEVIDLIVEAYRKSSISEKVGLTLVLGGKRDLVDKYGRENSDITVLNGLQYETLLSLYKGAEGLFIPLRNTIEDIARFPNKICEYLAAKGLIITTKFGEMQNYFVDGHNALVADDFSAEALIEKLDWLAENLDKVEALKENAQKDLFKVFDQDSNADAINAFLKSL